MEILHIIYKGKTNSVRTVVDRDGYEKNYKPEGWEIDKEYHNIPEDENIKELKTEEKIRNYKKMKKTTQPKFDDGLEKREENGEI